MENYDHFQKGKKKKSVPTLGIVFKAFTKELKGKNFKSQAKVSF